MGVLDSRVIFKGNPDMEGVSTVSTLSPTPTGNWEANQTDVACSMTSTSGNGIDFATTVSTDGSGNPTFTITKNGGGFSIGDTIVMSDPGSSIYTATLTVATLHFNLRNGDYHIYIDANSGDFMIAIKYDDTTKTTTLVDFSEI